MKARLIRIGNSRGVRLPRALVEEAQLGEEVDVRVDDGSIVIARSPSSRAGWADAAAQLSRRGEDGLIDPVLPTRFDEEEWEW